MSLPVVAGPALAIYAVEQGNVFAAQAAEATLTGLIAVAAFCVSYARMAGHRSWPLTLLAGWLSFAAAAALLYRSRFGVFVDLSFALIALTSARALIPQESATVEPTTKPAWDLPLRMATAAALVFTLTSLATYLGPGVSGILTPFPVVTAIIAAFTHAQAGPAAARRSLREFIPGLCTFGVFCLVLSATLRSFSLPIAFGSALVVQMALQGAILWHTSRHSRPSPLGQGRVD